MVKVFGKRGQAALEFLTTYGWAFMVILVMIGALAYFGVLNPQNLIPDQCSVTSGFSCGDYQVDMASSPNTVNFILLNNMNSQISIQNINITRAGGEACTNTPSSDISSNIADGAKFEISCETDAAHMGKSSGGKVKLGYSFEYQTSDGSYWHAASGTITATLK